MSTDEQLLKLAKYIVTIGHPPTDHACEQCVPGGPMVWPHFVCGYHTAKAIHESHQPKEPTDAR